MSAGGLDRWTYMQLKNSDSDKWMAIWTMKIVGLTNGRFEDSGLDRWTVTGDSKRCFLTWPAFVAGNKGKVILSSASI